MISLLHNYLIHHILSYSSLLNTVSAINIRCPQNQIQAPYLELDCGIHSSRTTDDSKIMLFLLKWTEVPTDEILGHETPFKEGGNDICTTQSKFPGLVGDRQREAWTPEQQIRARAGKMHTHLPFGSGANNEEVISLHKWKYKYIYRTPNYDSY